MMGSPEDEEERKSYEGPQHEVCVDGFWMGKYPVTQGEWVTVEDINPSQLQKGDRYPVERVSWNDVQRFLKKLNSVSLWIISRTLKQAKTRGFRLPTEAEWEYACRAGTTTPYWTGEVISPDQANYGEKYQGTTPVDKFAPNPFGLHDMHGNVWEWCQDVYDSDYYELRVRHNPSGPYVGPSRVYRGGSWCSPTKDLRAASRLRYIPTFKQDYIGFRLVRTQ